MAFRPDISVRWDTSPRIIFIAAPSTEVTIQDLHDTLTELEQRSQNMTYANLIKTSGKEPLGGGVFVGLTAELQNAVVAFEYRPQSDAGGTVTTADTTGSVLVDSVATFIADGIVPGDTVNNVTDASFGSVISVDSETQLTILPLLDGTDNQWEFGDTYKVWNKIQCEIAGGNLVAVDDVGAEMEPQLPTAFTYLQKTSSSSATLSEQSAIQYSSFGGGVSIDVTSVNTGTTYPVGTPEFPVNNMAHAHIIADTRGFVKFFIRGNITLTSEDLSDAHIFIGQSPTLTTVTVDPGVNVTNCEFRECTVTGVLDGGNTLRDCLVGSLNYVQGFLIDCGLSGTITLGGAAEAHFVNCHSGVPGSATPTINCGGSGQSLLMRNYSGGIKFTNKTGTDPTSVDIHSGQIIIDPTVTAGTIILRGQASIVDNSGSGATIDTSGLVFADQLQLAAFQSQVHLSASSGISGTEFPKGTAQYPLNNIADALTVASLRGLNAFHVHGTFVIGATDVVDEFTFIGANELDTVLILVSGCSTERTRFKSMIMTGTVSGGIFCEKVAAQNILGLGSDTDPTLMLDCVFLEGTIGFRTGLTTPQNVQFVRCSAGISSGSGTIIDMNTGTSRLAVREFSGALQLTNYTDANDIELEFSAGAANIASSCTAGSVTLRGPVVVTDASAVGCTVDIAGVLNRQVLADQVAAIPIDGITAQEYAQAVMAVLAGKFVVTNNGPGDDTIEFKAQDDTTTFVTGRIIDGVRTESNVNEENM